MKTPEPRGVCDHYNKSYGPAYSQKRPWICRDCGQQGHIADTLYNPDYYDTLIQHLQAGTLKGEEEGK